MSSVLRQKADFFTKSERVAKIINKSSDFVESQFLQRSKIPTLHFQKSLPRLPIPKLELTCQRYLAAQRPLLLDDAYRNTETKVQDFSMTVGKDLQEMLIKFDNNNKHTSYISEPWFDMYLSDRKPLPINYNPMLVMSDDERPGYNNQLIRATNMIVSSLRFYKSLKANLLEPEVYHMNPKKSDTLLFRNVCAAVPASVSWYAAYMFNAYPLDMSQYPNLFNSSRVPETDKDRIVQKTGSHITVQYRGHFYAFRVIDNDDSIIPAEVIMGRLKSILNDDVKSCEFPVGVLTTTERNKWATVRHLLAKNGNELHLKFIDSALFNVCLDEETVGADPCLITRQFLHGDGHNRWFDKSFSLILSKDGVAAVNFEHSWGDGVAVLRYVQDIHKDAKEKPTVHPDTVPQDININEISRLDFNLNDSLKAAISEADKSYETVCKSLDVSYLITENMGKNLCKKHSISPDSMMQVAFQAAYHKLYQQFVPTYESCSTAAFKHGRTETIRPCTMATKTFSLSLNVSKDNKSELRQMLAECSKIHNQLTKEAAMGQGFDRHLFALRRLAQRNGISCKIFDDPAYATINQNIISTSTLNSPVIFAGGFGPVVQNGLGLGYVIKDDFLGVLLTTYHSHQNGPAFIDALKVTFKEILDILESK